MIVTASALNVRSGPGTNFRVITRLLNGDRAEVLETHGDWAWVKPGDGWVSRSYLAPDSMFAPVGLSGIRMVFGEPGAPECSAGRVNLPRPLRLGWANASVTRVACHVKMEEAFTNVFREIDRRGLWSLIHTFDGIYNDRPTRAGGKKSTHAWGIAVDLNASTNRQGSQGDMDKRIVSVFEEFEFQWGGEWLGNSRDPMHFQFARGY